jgi:3D-(3,5/4)-trihydroxycyclohexane-1,2-dione acylhydrolase (decyclizing)
MLGQSWWWNAGQRGYGCSTGCSGCGGAPFNNLLDAAGSRARRDRFALHAKSLGCLSEHPRSVAELDAALIRARSADRTTVIVIDTDPNQTTEDGGAWWEVGVPEVSEREAVRAARTAYEQAKKTQRA